jgi:lysozyme family protein
MTEDELIADVFVKEGDTYGDTTTHPPIDQPTGRGGITLATLRAFITATKTPLTGTVTTLKALTRDQAEDIVRWKLRQTAAENRFDRISFEPLRLQMIDFSFNSGPSLAIRWLQRVLRVPRTGAMDGDTLKALVMVDQWLVNQALIAARLEMIDRWTDGNKQAKAWEEGLESRGLSFSLLEVP